MPCWRASARPPAPRRVYALERRDDAFAKALALVETLGSVRQDRRDPGRLDRRRAARAGRCLRVGDHRHDRLLGGSDHDPQRCAAIAQAGRDDDSPAGVSLEIAPVTLPREHRRLPRARSRCRDSTSSGCSRRSGARSTCACASRTHAARTCSRPPQVFEALDFASPVPAGGRARGDIRDRSSRSAWTDSCSG